MLRGGLLAGTLGGFGLVAMALAATVVASLVPALVQLCTILNCFVLLASMMAIGGWAPQLSGGRVVGMGGGLVAGALAGLIALELRALAQVGAGLALSSFLGRVVAASPVGTFEFMFPGRVLSPAEAAAIACLAGALIAMVGGILGGIGGLLFQALLAPEGAAPASSAAQESSI